MKFRITRIGAYLYHRRWTLAFNWSRGWYWWPERVTPGTVDGWHVWWGWFALELLRWPAGDDWGVEAGESMAETLDWILGDLDLGEDD